MRRGAALAVLLVLAGVGSRAAQAPPASGVLYRFEMLQAAPGRLLELIDNARERAGLAAAAGDEAPEIVRHSQGDHWDLLLVWPMGEWAAYHDPARRAKRPAGLEAPPDALVSWHEDLFVRGPSVEALRAHMKGAGLAHFEMMQALPGRRAALIEERGMENAFNRYRGRGETLIFVREAGADWDVVTLGVYRDWRQYAESDAIPRETSDAAAKKAGFTGAEGVGPYMRTLISTHRDTLGPPIRLSQ